MAEDSEKRLHMIMDKLFYAPKSKSSASLLSGTNRSRGNKRAKFISMEKSDASNSMRNFRENGFVRTRVTNELQTPICRPWDRGDLMRRLSTFKSMTWFGKPKVVSPINCARRGWVNMELDIIACEICGARLFFSTPPSWTHQQVEKTAAVFSLKLDNGHKLLCPWIDNVCDEKLAQFPPTTAALLVEEFKERFSALLHLSDLPLISSSAITYMKSPQLQNFLATDSMSLFTFEFPSILSRSESTLKDSELLSSDLYYQAQKIIALCGWKVRSLPYVVECEGEPMQSAKDTCSSESILITNEQNHDQISPTVDANEGAEIGEVIFPSRYQIDPASTVLDCGLCGASVGLWAFFTVPRPLELFRLIGFVDHYSKNLSDIDACSNPRLTAGSLDSKLSIAGGPPPTRQNFRASVSLPIISRHLIPWLSVEFSKNQKQEHDKPNSQTDDNLPEYGNKDFVPDLAVLKRKRAENEDEPFPSRTIDFNEESGPNGHLVEMNSHQDVELCSEKSSLELFSVERDLPSVHATIELPKPMIEKSIDASETCNNISGNSALLENTVSSDANHLNRSVSSHEVVTEVYSILPNTPSEKLMERQNGKDTKLMQTEKKMEFDPIMQHRHFCPWILTTDSCVPGWQQTLLALTRDRDTNANSSTLVDSNMHEVNDTITSIRNLFKSPPTKSKASLVAK